MNRLPVDRSATLYLVPKPNSASIARVLVLEEEAGLATILDVDPIIKNPRILDEIISGYASAIRFWDWFAAALFWGGIITSFLWRWWIFVPAILAAVFLWRMNRRSIAQFAAGACAEFPEQAMAIFKHYGLIWQADSNSLQRDRT